MTHINDDGEFQSDKYPSCPAGKVPLSTADPSAQSLLWEYAQRRRKVDAEFSADLEIALKAKGYTAPLPFPNNRKRELARQWLAGEAPEGAMTELCMLLAQPAMPDAEFPIITKDCEKCGDPVADSDDPSFKDQWLCYWCHCLKDGRDAKAALNSMSTLIKGLNRLAARHNPKAVSPETAARVKADMATRDPVTALANIMEALRPQADPDVLEEAGRAWDAWDAERDEFQKVLRQMELALHVAGLMEHAEALGIEALARQTP